MLLASYHSILTLADIYSHRGGDTGALSREDRRRVIAYNWDGLWTAQLGQSTDGYGLGHRDLVQAALSQLVTLPPDFLGLLYLYRSDQGNPDDEPRLVTPRIAALRGFRSGRRRPAGAGVYLLEGPGKEFNDNTQQYETYPQRARLMPSVEAGATVTLGYRTQAPSFGDPTVADDDLIQVDVIAQPFQAYLVQSVVAAMAAREEQAELRRALGSWQDAVEETRSLKGKQDRIGVVDVDQLRLQNIRSGYGAGGHGGGGGY